MPEPLDPTHSNLLSRLCEVLQNPNMPTLLQQLSSPICSPIPTPSSGTIDSTQTDSAAEDERARILRRLESTVEMFRNGNSFKMATISSILGILGENTYVMITQSQKDATFDSHLTKILSIQSTFDESNGLHSSGIEHSQLLTNSRGVNNKRNFRKPQTTTDPDSDDDDKPVKRQKLLESDMPWFIDSDDSSFDHCDPYCKETCRLL
jgi:hypothetical protein